MKSKKGFTLIELLVVIAIIALLVSILMPALNKARDNAKKTKCMADLHGLGQAVLMYIGDNNGWTHHCANNGLWEDMNTGRALGPDESMSYWGIAYSKYADNREIFTCPAAKRVDDWPEAGYGIKYQKFFKYCTYGMNGYMSHQKVGKYRAGEVIFCQDHIEQRLDGISQDMFCIGPGQTVNLPQWRPASEGGWGFVDSYWAGYDTVGECFRHYGNSNTLWLDGHVTDIARSLGEGISTMWYTGVKN